MTILLKMPDIASWLPADCRQPFYFNRPLLHVQKVGYSFFRERWEAVLTGIGPLRAAKKVQGPTAICLC